MTMQRSGRAAARRTWRRTALSAGMLALGGLAAATGPAAAQAVLQMVAPNPVEPATAPLPNANRGAVATGAPSAQVGTAQARFVLHGVQLEGAHAIPPARLAKLWAAMPGRLVSGADIAALARRIAAAYDAAGYALVNVQVPNQDFAGGVLRIVVQEGYVGKVVIQGNTAGADLSLLKAYAAHIIEDRPLRRATLERYVLLMNDIPGLKVGSRFVPVPGHPGVAGLQLSILRKRADFGVQVNNQGNPTLGNTQVTLNAAVNSLFQQGDRTQAVLGAPIGIRRYQYYGLSHSMPIGSNGATLSLGVGHLVTHPAANAVGGSADTVVIRLSDPVIRSLRESLVLNLDLAALNSDTAFLGQSVSSERTRSVRVGAVYAKADDWDGTTLVSATLSHGFDGLGARRGNIAFGGPDYTKIAGVLAREQKLPWDFTLRARATAQYSAHHLPSTEQFLVGGPSIGRAFDYAYMAGDSGVAAYAEIAHPWPAAITPRLLHGSEVFAYADWGEVRTVGTPYQLAYAHAASAGGGVRIRIADRFSVELGAGWVLSHSARLPHVSSPRVLFGITGRF